MNLNMTISIGVTVKTDSKSLAAVLGFTNQSRVFLALTLKALLNCSVEFSASKNADVGRTTSSSGKV